MRKRFKSKGVKVLLTVKQQDVKNIKVSTDNAKEAKDKALSDIIEESEEVLFI